MEKDCIEVQYNYRQAMSDGRECYPDEFDTYKLGVHGVIEIKEHAAQGEGDKWYYDVITEDGVLIRVFNPHKAIYKLT